MLSRAETYHVFLETILLKLIFFNFCLGTGVPRHSAGGVGTFVRPYVRTYMRGTYVVRIVCNAHARVMEAENSITLTIYSSEHVFIALRWRSEMIMGFHEYTYQDREYIIWAMNTEQSMLSAHARTFSW